MQRIGIKLSKFSILTFPIAVAIIPILIVTSIVVAILSFTFQFIIDVLS